VPGDILARHRSMHLRYLCGLSEGERSTLILIGRKWTPDMAQDLSRSLGECLEMLLYIREQQLKRVALMIMGHDPSRDTPEPFNAVGVGIIGRRIDQVQVLFQFSEHTAHEQGASRRVGLEIVSKDDGHSSSLFGTSYSSTYLLAEHLGRAPRSDPAIEPAIAPVHQAEAIDLAIVPRRFDQALPTSPFEAPDTRESRVKGHLHFILQIEVSAWHKGEQIRQVGGKLIPQISFHQVMGG
jgi:hypothetical protein